MTAPNKHNKAATSNMCEEKTVSLSVDINGVQKS
jgi:hypothetical protein